MKLEFTLKEIFSKKETTVTVDDMVSPTGGYTQAYIDRAGNEYAKYRATEMLNGTWKFVSGVALPIPKSQRTA